MWRAFFCALFLIVGCEAKTPPTKNGTPTIQQTEFVASKAQSSTVRIIAIGDDFSTGSGVIIGEHLILTNKHVIAGANSASGIYFIDRAGFPKPIQAILDVNSLMDLAVLYVRSIDGTSASLALSPPSQLDQVIALGFPAATDMIYQKMTEVASMTKGQVTAIDDGSISGFGTIDLITHTATVNPGNSGGPLFNECGEVVGINTLKADPAKSSNVFVASSVKEIAPYLGSIGVSAIRAKDVCIRPATSSGITCSADLEKFNSAIAGADLTTIQSETESLPASCVNERQKGWALYSEEANQAVAIGVRIEGDWRMNDGDCGDPVSFKSKGLYLAAKSGDQIAFERIVASKEQLIQTRTVVGDDGKSKAFSYEIKSANLIVTNLDTDKSWELERCTG